MSPEALRGSRKSGPRLPLQPESAEPDLQLLVGSGEFWTRLQTDVASARERIWIQTLTFEGDRPGKELAAFLASAQAPDRRVLVDEYTRWVQNDRFLLWPPNRLDPSLRAEAAETARLMRDLPSSGVEVRWGSRWGFLLRRAFWRNHRKLAILDDEVCYLGGMNFSEHNFAWHDLMLRIRHPGVTAHCAEDFELAWTGRRRSRAVRCPGLELLSVDPPDLAPYEEVWRRIAEAKSEIHVESAYVTFPLTDALAEAAARGVRVVILSPEDNNRPVFRRHIEWEATRRGFELHLLPGMTHMKAILIDGDTLVIGSSNFHFIGHWTQNETVALITDATIVETFRRRVLEVDLARSSPARERRGIRGSLLRVWMALLARVMTLAGRGCAPRPRAVAELWPFQPPSEKS